MTGRLCGADLPKIHLISSETASLKTALKDEAGNYLYGLTDKSGKVIFEPKYYSIAELREGYSCMQKNNPEARPLC